MKLVDEIKLRDSYIRFLLKHFKIESFCFPDGTLYESENNECSHNGDDICNEGYACDECPKKRLLSSLSKEEFELLRASGMMWEIYPDAPDVYENIVRIEDNIVYTGDNEPTDLGVNICVIPSIEKIVRVLRKEIPANYDGTHPEAHITLYNIAQAIDKLNKDNNE